MSGDTKQQLDKITGGALVEVDIKKLGVKGARLLGRVDAMKDCVAMFTHYRNRSVILSERQTLSEVVAGLEDGLAAVNMELVEYARSRGATKMFDVPAIETVGETEPVRTASEPEGETNA